MKPDVLVELKGLRLHGMAGAWADLIEQGGNAGIESSRWLIEHLLQAEGVDRSMRSVGHQMKTAKFADKVVGAMRTMFVAGEFELQIGASVGVAYRVDESGDTDELIARADAMLYRAKRLGRGRRSSE